MSKCSECGLLTVLDAYTNEAVKASERARRGWHESSNGSATRANVACLDGLRSDLRNVVNLSEFLAIVELEKDIGSCPSFRQFNPALTPKEHKDMSIVEQVKAEYAQQRTDDLEWRRQVNERDEKRHIENRKDIKRYAWVAAGAGVAAAVIGSLVSAWFK